MVKAVLIYSHRRQKGTNNMTKRYNPIFFMEKNHRGAWVVYGDIGVKQYYYYTKTGAAKLYKEEAWTKQGQFVNQ